MDITGKTTRQLYEHAYFELKARWPQAEPIIMRDPYLAYCYAKEVIHGRWPEAEKYIMSHHVWGKFYYTELILEDKNLDPKVKTLLELKFSEYL